MNVRQKSEVIGKDNKQKTKYVEKAVIIKWWQLLIRKCYYIMKSSFYFSSFTFQYFSLKEKKKRCLFVWKWWRTSKKEREEEQEPNQHEGDKIKVYFKSKSVLFCFLFSHIETTTIQCKCKNPCAGKCKSCAVVSSGVRKSKERNIWNLFNIHSCVWIERQSERQREAGSIFKN